MSWGSTAFTPIVMRNQPPFGFHEVINPPDFKVCNQNPWGTGDRLKREIQDKLKMDEYRRKLNITDKSDFDLGYDMDYTQATQLRCANDSRSFEQFVSGSVFGLKFSQMMFMCAMLAFVIFWVYKKKLYISV